MFYWSRSIVPIPTYLPICYYSVSGICCARRWTRINEHYWTTAAEPRHTPTTDQCWNTAAATAPCFDPQKVNTHTSYTLYIIIVFNTRGEAWTLAFAPARGWTLLSTVDFSRVIKSSSIIYLTRRSNIHSLYHIICIMLLLLCYCAHQGDDDDGIIYHRCRIGEINIISARLDFVRATYTHTHSPRLNSNTIIPLSGAHYSYIYISRMYRQTDTRTPLQTEPTSSHCALVQHLKPPPRTKYNNVPTRIHALTHK